MKRLVPGLGTFLLPLVVFILGGWAYSQIPILQDYVEEDHSVAAIVEQGFDRDLVERVVRMVDRNEYKRRQSAPGVRITTKGLGRDRRLPITNGFRR